MHEQVRLYMTIERFERRWVSFREKLTSVQMSRLAMSWNVLHLIATCLSLTVRRIILICAAKREVEPRKKGVKTYCL